MTTSNIVWIVIAVVVAVLLLAILVVVTRRQRHLKAEGIREQVRVETTRVDRREALAEETSAKARAAQAEAEAKAAEAARLQQRAAEHQSAATTSREDLGERWKHADHIDPKAKPRQDANGLADDSGNRLSDEADTSTAARPDTRRE
jgi:flagellar biosynthesis/type III secretory pathway M-ring protein FliF/YscJ